MGHPNAKEILHHIFSGSFADTGYFGLKDMSNSTFIDQVFPDDFKDRSQQRTDIVAHFSKHPVFVLGSFPREESQYPCLIIQRVGDNESPDSPLGDIFSETIENGVKTTCKGTRFNETIELYIAVANTNGDLMRDEIYQAVRQIFVRAKLWFEGQGLQMVKWNSGSDGQIEIERKARPLVMHTASIILSFTTDMTFTETSNQQPSSNIQSSLKNPDTDEGQVTVLPFQYKTGVE